MQVGYGELLLRAVGRYPFKSWLLAWLVTFWIWMVLQVSLGVPWRSLLPGPPARESIRYKDFHGIRSPGNHVLWFDEEVLVDDPPLPRSRMKPQVADGEGRAILVSQTTSHYTFGWPLVLCFARGWKAWDISSPSHGFEPARNVFEKLDQDNLDNSFAFFHGRDNSWSLRLIPQSTIAWSMMLLALWPTLPVGCLWLGFTVRQRRRRRRAACSWCGHLRGPLPSSGLCSECGQLSIDETKTVASWHRVIRSAGHPGGFFVLWFVLLLLAFATLWSGSPERPVANLDQSVRDSAEHWAGYARQQSINTSSESGIRAAHRRVGWPWPFLIIERWRWWSLGVDGTASPVSIDQNLSFRHDRPGLDWHSHDVDPFVLNWYIIYLVPAALTVMVAGLVAGHLMFAMLLSGRIVCSRRRSSTSITLNA